MRRVSPRNYRTAVSAELPPVGKPVMTRIHARRDRGVWSISSVPRDRDTLFSATWRYPTVGVWRRITGYGGTGVSEERIWQYALLDTSFLSQTTVEDDEISTSTYREIMDFSPSLIPAALVRDFSGQISLSSAESLRIERECFSLWTSHGGGVKNPHPILADVIWSMSLHEKFGIQSWGPLDQIHVKVYEVMRKAMECYAQAQDINNQAIALRQRAQRESGIGPGGSFGPQRR